MVNFVDDRITLHNKLVSILKTFTKDDKARVWFKRPSNVTMSYPCVVYSRNSPNNKYADNLRYLMSLSYECIVMDKDSDSELVEKILEEIPSAQLTNEYTNDGIYHYAITIPNGSQF